MENLNQLMEQYLRYCENRKNLNPKTTKAYRIDLEQYLRYVNSEMREGLERNTLDLYITKLHQEYKPKTIKRKIASLKAFFHYLTYIEIIEDNPFHKIDISFREPKLLPKSIPLHTMQTFLSSIYKEKAKAESPYQKKCFLRDIAVCELLFATGMRISELCSLTANDIDLENGTIRIYGKGSKERILQIGHPDVILALNAYKAAFLTDISKEDAFFVNRLHRQLSDQSVRFMINKYVELSGIQIHITPHMFRHPYV